jgi:hypothetical protein
MSGDLNWKYGLNFTELNIIREEKNISFLFMLSGHEYSEIFTEKDVHIAELEARIRELGG